MEFFNRLNSWQRISLTRFVLDSLVRWYLNKNEGMADAKSEWYCTQVNSNKIQSTDEIYS